MSAWDAALDERKTKELTQRAIDSGWIAHNAPISLQILAEAGPNADRSGYVDALTAAGYGTDVSIDMEYRIELIVALCRSTLFDPDTIWSEKSTVGQIATRHGYVPVGHEHAPLNSD